MNSTTVMYCGTKMKSAAGTPHIIELLHDTHVIEVVIEWLTLLHYIWEVSGSNLGLETDYPDCFFVVFLSSPRQMPG
jgi:hypothetical protein